MSNVVTDLTNAINAVAGLTKGTNLYQGPQRGPNDKFPRRCVFVTSIGGEPPSRTMQEVSETRFATLNVMVRWHGFAGGDTMARLIQDTLQAISISGYLDVVAMQSEPTFIGEDDENNFIWSSGYQLVYEEVK